MSCVLAGVGLNDCGANSEIDDLSKSMVRDLVSISDFFAVVCIALHIDSSNYLSEGDRPVPKTDNGKTIKKLISKGSQNDSS